MNQSTFTPGNFASTYGYFDRSGNWQTDTDLAACGLVVDTYDFGVVLEFAAGTQVRLGIGLLHIPEAYEIASWKRMRGETSEAAICKARGERC